MNMEKSKAKQIGLIFVQVALLYGVSLGCDQIASFIHSPVPGSIIGFALLFLLLQLKIVRLSWFERGANWLLANLLLFFVPSAVGIVQYGHMLKVDGLRLLFVIAVSTTIVMLLTGTMADCISRWVNEKRTRMGRKVS